MAFTPNSLSLAVDTIAGGALRIHFYETTDSRETVMGDGYFAAGRSRGLRNNDLIIVADTTATADRAVYQVNVVDVDTAGDATVSLTPEDIRTVAEFEAMRFPNAVVDSTTAVIQGHTIPGVGRQVVIYRATEPSHVGKRQTADGKWWEIEEATLKSFGALGQSLGGADQDDTDAIQEAIDYAKEAKVVIECEQDIYGIYSALDFLTTTQRSKTWGLRPQGASRNVTFECHFNGYDEAVIDGRYTNISGSVVRAPELSNIYVTYHTDSTENPIAFAFSNNGGLKMRDCGAAASNNTHFWCEKQANSDNDVFVSFGGGHNFQRKSAEGITFNITAGDRTLTTTGSVSHFTSADVGKMITVTDSGGREYYTISSYTSASEVEVDHDSILTMSDALGWWEPARVATFTAADLKLIADGECFVAEHVGMRIFIPGARDNDGMLPAKIATYTSATTVTVSIESGLVAQDVSDVPFANGVVVIGTANGSNADHRNNDLRVNNIHVEKNSGVALILNSNVHVSVDNFKNEAENAPEVDTNDCSVATLWMSSSNVSFTGRMEFLGNPISQEGRIHFCGLEGQVDIYALEAGIDRYERLASEAGNDPDGFLKIHNLTLLSEAVTTATLEHMVLNEDPADPRIIILDQPKNGTGSNQLSQVLSAPGNLYRGWLETFVQTSTAPYFGGSTNDGTISYTTANTRCYYWRDNYIVHFALRVQIDTVTAQPSGTLRLNTGIPYSAVDVVSMGFPCSLGQVTFNLATAGAAVHARISPGLSLIQFYEIADNAAPYLMVGSGSHLVTGANYFVSGWFPISGAA